MQHKPGADTHDNVVRWVAANRYPFPDQTDWPASYRTITNETERHRGIPTDEGIRYPDIVIVDSNTGQVVEIGEVEVETGEHLVEKWAFYASICKEHPASGRRHFFVYVPEGLEGQTQQLLDAAGIPYGGIRTWNPHHSEMHITPIVTPVDRKDHR
jgi:hypothetical protein